MGELDFQDAENAILSKPKAKHVAPDDARKELLPSRQVWRFMLPGKVMPYVLVFEDTLRAVQLSTTLMSISNSKHIRVVHHLLRLLVRQG